MFRQFVILVANKREEGLYNLQFYNCRNFDPTKPRSRIDMSLMVCAAYTMMMMITMSLMVCATLFLFDCA